CAGYPHGCRMVHHRRATRFHEDLTTMRPQLNIRARILCAALAAPGFGTGLCVNPPAQAQEKSARPTLGTIERLDPRFDKLVPRDARVERIAEGFDWSEGPVWDWRHKRL